MRTCVKREVPILDSLFNWISVVSVFLFCVDCLEVFR